MQLMRIKIIVIYLKSKSIVVFIQKITLSQFDNVLGKVILSFGSDKFSWVIKSYRKKTSLSKIFLLLIFQNVVNLYWGLVSFNINY